MKVGDKVFVRKPDNLNEGPGWIPAMDKYHRTVQEVKLTYDNYVKIKSDTGCHFLNKWVTPVIESDGQYYKIADKHDVGKNVIVSNHLEIEDMIKAHKGLWFGELVRINDIGLPFQVREPGDTISESWRRAVVEVGKVDNCTYKIDSSCDFSGFYEGTILCETEQEAYALLSYWDSLGCLWDSGKKPLEFEGCGLFFSQLDSKLVGLPCAGYTCHNGFIRHASTTLTGAKRFSDIKGAAELMKRYPLKIIDNYLKEGIWCETLEEKHALLSYLSDKGYKWRDGQNIHDFDWKRYPTLMRVAYEGTGLCHGDERKDSPFFSTLTKYSEIMRKYSPAAVYTTKESEIFTHDGKKFRLATKDDIGKKAWFTDYGIERVHETELRLLDVDNGFFITGICRWKYAFIEIPKKAKESSKSEEMLGSDIIAEKFGWPVPISKEIATVTRGLSDGLLAWNSGGRGIYFDPSLLDLSYDEKSSKEIINPAASAAKHQKESKMALLSLASKKVRGLAYGALDWAFVSPLKRTFKPVATIAQFSVCYLTLAAAGYFAYGLYQNPQSVVEWISEISPVEIRLKNSEE